jgi:glycosyltransferase involved in cell wall biosynthesis
VRLKGGTVFGVPTYGRADSLAQTLESLLGQTREDLAVVIVDDRPTPEVRRIVETYAHRDPRVVYEANPVRLGMIANWRHAFERGRALFPAAEYFAWASDHDLWHPRWLEALAGALDAQSEVVLAYPRVMRLYRKYRRRVTPQTQTVGLSSRVARMRIAIGGITAGNAVYGLFRASALARAGVFRPVLLPDRQLVGEIALFGAFVQVPEILWYREVAGAFSYGRQRHMLFPGRAPLYTRLPVSVQHAGVLLWDLVVRGRGHPDFGRLAGAGYTAAQLWETSRRTTQSRHVRPAMPAPGPQVAAPAEAGSGRTTASREPFGVER